MVIMSSIKYIWQFADYYTHPVCVKLKIFNAGELNIFDLNETTLPCSLKLAKFRSSSGKIVFWSTLAAPSEKTIHIQELVVIFKVVLNNIIDIIYFDKNNVSSNLKELCKIKNIIKFMSLVNFGGSRRQKSAK